MNARVVDAVGIVHGVESFGEFTHIIAGVKFNFVITADLIGKGYNVVHKDSGQRVCKIEATRGASPGYLKTRARVALCTLSEKLGVTRLCDTLESARPLP